MSRAAQKHCARLTATLAVIGLVLTSSGVAIAMAPYTVSLKVPSVVKRGHQLKVTASGESANLSRLTVFLAGKACAASAAHEHGVSGAKLIINKQVVNAYSKSAVVTAKVLGKRHACAYLTGLPPQSLPRAHAFASYTVIT